MRVTGRTKVETELDHIRERQPNFSHWLEQLSDLASTQPVPYERFKIFGAGLVIERADEDLLVRWLSHTCRRLEMPFEISDLTAGPEALERLKSANLRLSVTFLKGGDWLLEQSQTDESVEVRTSLIEILRTKASRSIMVCYSKSYVDVAHSLRYEGLFDRHFRWADHTPEVLARDFIRETGMRFFDAKLKRDQLRLGRLLAMDFSSERRQGILRMSLKRRWHEQKRRITWLDIVETAVNGTGKGELSGDQINPYKVAVHEAGHVVMCIEAAEAKNFPEFVSIVPNRFSLGRVTEDINWAYLGGQSRSLGRSLWQMKIALSGRIAEEVVFGPLGVGSSSAYEDLQEASSISYQLMSEGGFHPAYPDGLDLGESLYVVSDESPASLRSGAATNAKQLLARMHKEATTILVDRLPLVTAVADALLEHKILTEEDLKCLFENFRDRRNFAGELSQ